MQISNLNNIVTCDADVNHIVCIHQQWTTQSHSWSYLDTPRPCDGFIYIVRGSAIYTTPKGQKITAQCGDIMYLPKGSRYFIKMEPVDAVSITINFTLSYKNDDLLLAEQICLIAKDTNRLLYELFDDLCTVYLETTDRFLIKSKLLVLFSELSRAQFSNGSQPPIHAAIAYVNHHINMATDIPAIAKMFAMSERTFRREFSRIVGCSPKKYISEQRIKKAKQLLSRGDLPISEICTALGFFDTSYFIKVFKEHTGTTPAAYRNKSARHL